MNIIILYDIIYHEIIQSVIIENGKLLIYKQNGASVCIDRQTVGVKERSQAIGWTLQLYV